MQLSRFAYFKPVDGQTVALYHALQIRTIFVEKAVAETLQAHGGESRALFDAGFLVESSAQDDAQLQTIRDSLVGRQSGVAVLYLLLTDECNLACEYCFIENQLPTSQVRQFLSKDAATAAIDLFAREIARDPVSAAQKKTIIFYGGEPLLNKPVLKHAVACIDEHRRKGTLPDTVRLSLVTNGISVTEEMINFLKKHSINVAVSIDGDRNATDCHRRTVTGQPVFDRALASFRRMQQEGVNVGVSCTINQETLRDPDHSIDFLVNEIGARGIGFNILYRGHSIGLPEDYETRAADMILHAYERFRQVGVYENRIMRKVDAFTEKRLYPFDCAASGGRQIVVAPDGAVGICHGYLGSRKHFVGTVFDDELSVRETPTYALWRRRSPLLMPQCEGCPVVGLCGGGCPCDAESTQGSIWGLDARFCVHAKRTLDWLISDLWRALSSKPTDRLA